jgi:phosphoribosylaminoimidazole carboxylase (NCAIR synthetase)
MIAADTAAASPMCLPPCDVILITLSPFRHPATSLPNAGFCSVLQDKYAQKVHFAKHGVPLPEFKEITSRADMEATGRQFGYPFMLKSKR